MLLILEIPGRAGGVLGARSPVCTGQVPNNGTAVTEIRESAAPTRQQQRDVAPLADALLLRAVLIIGLIVWVSGCSFKEKLTMSRQGSGAVANPDRQPAPASQESGSPTKKTEVTPSVPERSPAQQPAVVSGRSLGTQVPNSNEANTPARTVAAVETKGAEKLLRPSASMVATASNSAAEQREASRAKDPPARAPKFSSNSEGFINQATKAKDSPARAPQMAESAGSQQSTSATHFSRNSPGKLQSAAASGWLWTFGALAVSMTAGLIAIWSFRQSKSAADIPNYEMLSEIPPVPAEPGKIQSEVLIPLKAEAGRMER